jgi:hypothetical protein
MAEVDEPQPSRGFRPAARVSAALADAASSGSDAELTAGSAIVPLQQQLHQLCDLVKALSQQQHALLQEQKKFAEKLAQSHQYRSFSDTDVGLNFASVV